jgi:predicted RNA-binding Zn ribbon-like protein
MALKLDNTLLEEIGLAALPADEKSKMLAHIYETLEMRVGVKLAEQMSDQQLDEFESFINTGDEAGALKWLETTFPSYKQVVADEFENLKSEIAQVAPQIVAESQAQIATPDTPAPNTSIQQPN